MGGLQPKRIDSSMSVLMCWHWMATGRSAQVSVGRLVLFGKVGPVLAPLHVRIVLGHRFEMTVSLDLPNKLRVRIHKCTRTITLSTGQTKGLTAIRVQPKFMIHI